jgi:hypothetical protein
MSSPGITSPPMSSSAPPSDVLNQLVAALQGLQQGGLQGHAQQHKSFSSVPKSLTPDLNKNTFNSTTNPDGLEGWIQQTGSIVASVSEAGRELEELLDSSTKRNVGREAAHVITTVPVALQGDDICKTAQLLRLSRPSHRTNLTRVPLHRILWMNAQPSPSTAS